MTTLLISYNKINSLLAYVYLLRLLITIFIDFITHIMILFQLFGFMHAVDHLIKLFSFWNVLSDSSAILFMEFRLKKLLTHA